MDWSMQAYLRPVVLVVDDEDAVRKLIHDILESEGYRVLTARHSVDALHQAAEFPGTIDLLLTDYEMKIFQNGADLASCIRILRPETRILLTSASAMPEEAGSGGEAWNFLAKPFSRHQLLERVGSLARGRDEAWQPARLELA